MLLLMLFKWFRTKGPALCTLKCSVLLAQVHLSSHLPISGLNGLDQHLLG
uniref:Uncharacterized protein n=1 Tax=Anguilla anguilla TaxID=7936 RepID=A0A0E9W397_ANGAN